MDGAGVKLHTGGRVRCSAVTEVNGDIFEFMGRTGSVGVVKILEPITSHLNYFEYVITSAGEMASIGIGVGDREYLLDRMPGWNRNSIGYHADDGKLYHEAGFGAAFGPSCTAGDRMGCGVVFDSEYGGRYVHVFFTKNSCQLGNLVKMRQPAGGLYPLVGMHSRGEKVRYLGHWKKLLDGKAKPKVYM